MEIVSEKDYLTGKEILINKNTGEKLNNLEIKINKDEIKKEKDSNSINNNINIKKILKKNFKQIKKIIILINGRTKSIFPSNRHNLNKNDIKINSRRWYKFNKIKYFKI